ncbi:unnamed protein product, partial [Heterosigma akashiwo]
AEAAACGLDRAAGDDAALAGQEIQEDGTRTPVSEGGDANGHDHDSDEEHEQIPDHQQLQQTQMVSCIACTFENPPTSAVCEVCETALPADFIEV